MIAAWCSALTASFEEQDDAQIDANGEVDVTLFGRPSPWHEHHYRSVVRDLPIILGRVVVVQRAKVQNLASKQQHKKGLKDKVDVEMADVTPETRTLQKSIAAEVAKATRKPNKAPGKGPSKKGGNKGKGKESSSKVSHRFHPYPTHPYSLNTEGEGHQEVLHGFGICQEEAEELEQERGQEGLVFPLVLLARFWQDSLIAHTIRYNHPLSWPDWIIDEIPTKWAVVIITRTLVPVALLQANRIRHFVHIGPDIVVDNEAIYLFRELSLGYKFLLPSQTQPGLIKSSWLDFVNRLRWRAFFAKRLLTDEEFDAGSYDPDYKVPSFGRKAPNGDLVLEAAIRAGEEYVNSVISDIPPIHEKRSPWGQFVQRLHAYLEEKDYVVLPTDKNLGCSVVTREWFIGSTQKLLDDRSSYVPVTMEERCSFLRQKVIEINDVIGHCCNKQLKNFLTQFYPDIEPEDDNNSEYLRVKLPQFYGIPKIHKNPVKAHPIAPCHSALQNPIAKYSSKLLKPLIHNAKYVINGTKEFTDELRTLKLEPERLYKIITGDIVAYYPNIPMDDMIEVMHHIWVDYYFHTLTDSDRASGGFPHPDLLDKIVVAVMMSLIIQGPDGTVYRQIHGLAMGVACSPDIANLYGDWFERKWIHQANSVAFYKRYIDDIFAIVYTDIWDPEYLGEKDPKPYMNEVIAFEGCTIEWEPATRSLAFLDLWVYIDSDNSIQWKPYRKPGNHLERIPWNSTHPVDIKRGTYIGELSRLATLSSKLEHYLEAVRSLSDLYVRRGYPLAVIKKWSKSYVHRRWQVKDLPHEAEQSESVIVMKTIFNNLWENFSIHELEKAMIQKVGEYTTYWRERDSETPISPDEKLFLFSDDSLVDKSVDVFVEEFAGNLYHGLRYEEAVASFTDVTAPLLKRTLMDPDSGEETSYNMLNYMYWILGDRRFLLS